MRLTTSPAGIVADGPSSGRGAWLCRSDRVDANGVDTGDKGERGGTPTISGGTPTISGACLDAALSRRAFGRAWRRDLRPGEIEALRRLATNDDSHRAH